jgi:tetratricopeptide (TPR) repeat protein
MPGLINIIFAQLAVGRELTQLEQFEQQAELIFSIMTKLFGIGLIIVAIIYIVQVLRDKSYSIRHINVPAPFEKGGHSGAVVANRIYCRIQLIIQRVSANYHLKGYTTASAEKEVSVDVGGMGLPIRGFVEMLGGALGIRRSKKVDGDFFIENNVLVMILKIAGHPAERLEAPLNDSIDIALRTLVIEAAETILKYSNDEILQTYFGLIEQIGDKQIKLAKYRYEHCNTNANVEVNIIAAWAWGLCMLKKYDEAEQKIVEGVTKHKKAGRIYVIWGSLLAQKGQPKEALEKFTKALEQLSKNESITRIANLYSSMGRCYSTLGQHELAMNYFQRAIETDPNASRSYFNLALAQYANNDHEQFYEQLERALEKGFQTTNVLKDPTCSGLQQHPQMVKLMEKYAGE